MTIVPTHFSPIRSRGLTLLMSAALACVVHAEGDPAAAATSAPPAKSQTVEVTTPPVTAADVLANSEAMDRSLAEARKLVATGELPTARAALLAYLDGKPSDAGRKEAEDLLSAIAIPLVFNPWPMPGKVDYAVQAGDSLERISRQFDVSQELIRRGNRISNTVVRLGQRLRILNTPFSVVVDKSDNTLTVLMDGRFFKRYRVGTGQFSTTPTGTFKVTGRVAKPTWYRADGKEVPFGDKDNLLGTHWISLDIPHYGIHGTWDPATIGRQSSQGCIRLLNEDVEELFILLKDGTPVVIQD